MNGDDGMITFKKFENGLYKNKPIITRHPNIVYSVIKGKKSWGLWLNEWVDGIVDWSFTIDEIKGQFDDCDIEIPDSLWKDFNNILERKKQKRYL